MKKMVIVLITVAVTAIIGDAIVVSKLCYQQCEISIPYYNVDDVHLPANHTGVYEPVASIQNYP